LSERLGHITPKFYIFPMTHALLTERTYSGHKLRLVPEV
jgi:hypothetical protein